MSKRRTTISRRKQRAIIITTVLALSASGPALASSQTPPVVVQAPSVHVYLVIASGSHHISCHMLTLSAHDHRPAADYLVFGRPII
jgi:hypothetical protein